MDKQGIIDKLIGPTEWLNSLVTRDKSDDWLYICLDPNIKMKPSNTTQYLPWNR